VSGSTITGGNGTITGATARGFFIQYASATNSGTTVTAALGNASGKFNWCAYGSDYRPTLLLKPAAGTICTARNRLRLLTTPAVLLLLMQPRLIQVALRLLLTLPATPTGLFPTRQAFNFLPAAAT
jgi:hypothetical protein